MDRPEWGQGEEHNTHSAKGKGEGPETAEGKNRKAGKCEGGFGIRSTSLSLQFCLRSIDLFSVNSV